MPTDKPFSLRAVSSPLGTIWQLIGPDGRPVEQAAEFLRVVALRGLQSGTLRTYAHDMLCIYRWMHLNGVPPDRIGEEDLLDFVEHLCTHPPASPSTINRRLCLLQRFIAFLTGKPVIINAWQPLRAHRHHSRYGLLRVKAPRRVVRPLAEAEIVGFFNSLRCWRDRAITMLMFILGLRASEVLHIQLCDLDVQNMTLLVHGKGDRERVLPLAEELANFLLLYLRGERPSTPSVFLFVVLKGPRRGQPMTYATLRRIFRYHRRTTGITRANPHRFRHTFGANMIKARMSLLTLSKLMGHSSPKTTMRYVQVHDTDLRDQYLRALENLNNNGPDNG